MTRPLSTALLGWLLFLATVAAMPAVSTDSTGNIVGLGLVAVLAGGWLAWRRSRPALWCSLVLGLLQAVEGTAYVVADLGDDAGPGLVAADVLGALAGVLICAGSWRELRRRRQARAAGTSSSVDEGGTRQARSSSSPATDSATAPASATPQSTARSRRAPTSRSGSSTSR